MTAIRKNRISLPEIEQRVVHVADENRQLRRKLNDIERENRKLRAAVERVAPADTGLPDGFRADRRGDVFDRDGKHRGVMHNGAFVEGVPEHCTIDAAGVVRLFPFNEVQGRVIDGAYVSRDLAAEREQAAQEESARRVREREEGERVREAQKGIWRDVFGIQRKGLDGREYIEGREPIEGLD